jgi:hypothetical protein
VGVARKELIAAGISACRQRLEAFGLTHRWADIFTLPLTPGMLGWVSLGRAVHNGDGSMVVAPNIGLLHQEVERLRATCAQIPYHRYYPPTLLTNMGRLKPDHENGWVTFAPHASVEAAAEQVSQPIEEYGLPWMRAHASLAAIATLDGDKRYGTRLDPWRRAVISYLLGHPELAREQLHDVISQMEREGLPRISLETYRRFADALDQQMQRTS